MIRFVIAIAAVILAPATASWGAEWTPIGEEDSRIVLYAPGLSAGKFSKRDQVYKSEEWAIWRGYSVSPRAEVYLSRLHPGRHYRTKGNVKKGVKSWDFVKNRDVIFREKTSYSNVLGGGKYIEFVFDETECVAFQQYWGEAGAHMGTAAGTRFLYGYYCNERGSKLDRDTIHAVLNGIGVRGEKVPVAAGPATTRPQMTESFDGEWVLTITESFEMPEGARVKTKIVNNQFSVSFAAGGWRGEVSGAIDAMGKLVGSGYANASRVSGYGSSELAVLKFAADYENGAFEARAFASAAGSPLTFEITLTRSD